MPHDFSVVLVLLLLELLQLNQVRTVLPHICHVYLQPQILVLDGVRHFNGSFVLVNDVWQLVELNLELMQYDLFNLLPTGLLVSVNFEGELVAELVDLQVVLPLLQVLRHLQHFTAHAVQRREGVVEFIVV